MKKKKIINSLIRLNIRFMITIFRSQKMMFQEIPIENKSRMLWWSLQIAKRKNLKK